MPPSPTAVHHADRYDDQILDQLPDDLVPNAQGLERGLRSTITLPGRDSGVKGSCWVMKRVIAAVAVVLVMVSAVAYAYSLASVQHRRVLRADKARSQRTPTPTQTRAMQATGIPTTAAPSPERLRRGAPSRPTPVAPHVMSAAPSSPTPTATATSRPVDPPTTAPPAAAVPTHGHRHGDQPSHRDA